MFTFIFEVMLIFDVDFLLQVVFINIKAKSWSPDTFLGGWAAASWTETLIIELTQSS